MNYQQLWSPWRLAYISDTQEKQDAEPHRLLAGGDPSCFLCQGASGEDDRRRLVVERGRHSLTVLNRYPYNNGHLLVAPRAARRPVGRVDGRRIAGSDADGHADDPAIGARDACRGIQRGLESWPRRRRDCRGTSIGTSCRGGAATRTSCRSRRASVSFRNRWSAVGNLDEGIGRLTCRIRFTVPRATNCTPARRRSDKPRSARCAARASLFRRQTRRGDDAECRACRACGRAARRICRWPWPSIRSRCPSDRKARRKPARQRPRRQCRRRPAISCRRAFPKRCLACWAACPRSDLQLPSRSRGAGPRARGHGGHAGLRFRL